MPAPRDTVLLPRLTAIVPRPAVGRGGETTGVTVRTFPADAAVGLLSRDRSTLRGTLGGGGGAGALRALASEAAVGAKRPDEGREARGAVLFDAGVFGRAGAVPSAVGDLTVVLRGSVDGALRVPGPFDGVRGVGVLVRLRRTAVAVDGRAPVDKVDFEGDPGSFVGGLDTAAAGRDVEADDRALVAGTGAAIEAGVGANMSLAWFASVVSAVGGVGGAGAGAGAEDVSGMGAGRMSTCAGSTSSEAGGDADGVPPFVASGAGEMIGFGGELPLAPVPLVLPFVLTGGHSRVMRTSSLAGSPVLLEAALVAREGGPGVAGWRFCCCSKRPMRFATD